MPSQEVISCDELRAALIRLITNLPRILFRIVLVETIFPIVLAILVWKSPTLTAQSSNLIDSCGRCATIARG